MLTVALKPGSPYVLEMLRRPGYAIRWEATLALLEGDTAPYLAWHPNPWKGIEAHLEALIEEIKAFGDHPEHVQAFAAGRDKREFSAIKAAFDSQGLLHIVDGNHRSLILWATGHTVTAEVIEVHPEWQAVIDWVTKARRYQPHPHPLCSSLPPIRASVDRYRDIGRYLAKKGAKVVIEVGSSHGCGALAMAQQGLSVTALDIVAENCQLASSLFSCYPDEEVKAVHGGTAPACEFDALVSLSAHHHLAKDLETLDAWIRATSHAELQVIELPEPGSTRWTPALLRDLEADYQTIGQKVLKRIRALGGYKHRRTMSKDARYGKRETVALWK